MFDAAYFFIERVSHDEHEEYMMQKKFKTSSITQLVECSTVEAAHENAITDNFLVTV
jgi:hypothetical protein